MHRRRGVATVWLAAAGCLLVVGGLGAWHLQDQLRAERQQALERQAQTAAGSSGARPRPSPQPALAPAEPGAPLRLMIFRLGVDAPVVPVRAPRGTLVPPSDALKVGWWADGARPGDLRGSALIAGHTVHTGGGAFDHLDQVRRGDEVLVRTDGGALAYAVRSVRTYRKGVLSRRADTLFNQQVDGRLVLITCEDWDGRRYLSNVVVTAVPTTPAP